MVRSCGFFLIRPYLRDLKLLPTLNPDASGRNSWTRSCLPIHHAWAKVSPEWRFYRSENINRNRPFRCLSLGAFSWSPDKNLQQIHKDDLYLSLLSAPKTTLFLHAWCTVNGPQKSRVCQATSKVSRIFPIFSPVAFKKVYFLYSRVDYQFRMKTHYIYGYNLVSPFNTFDIKLRTICINPIFISAWK